MKPHANNKNGAEKKRTLQRKHVAFKAIQISSSKKTKRAQAISPQYPFIENRFSACLQSAHDFEFEDDSIQFTFTLQQQ